MVFYTAYSKKRPVRLKNSTRNFAYRSLQGYYGAQAQKFQSVSMDDTADWENLSKQERYNKIIHKIVSESPIRICDEELVSGAATLGGSIIHMVPAMYKGEYVYWGVSHLTIDFGTVVEKGVNFLEERIEQRLCDKLSGREREQLCGMQAAISSMKIWHRRYLSRLKTTKHENYEILKNVPFKPATTFHEAVQSLWFTFAFVRLCGNWPGIGRIDRILGSYLKKDLKEGKITLNRAREILASFFIKGCEWIRSDAPPGSGDAQHYQNLVLAGIDEKGEEITNEVTYLVLDIVEELPIGDFPITVRVNENTPEKLLKKAAKVIRHGGGVVAIYNEPLILRSLEKFGYDKKEARNFANDGCWEVQIPGKTFFTYLPFDALQVLLNDTLRLNEKSAAKYNSYEELYSAFLGELRKKIKELYGICENKSLSAQNGGDELSAPCSVVSLFEQGCIENCRSYLDGGPVYDVISPHIGGAPDVGNSLYIIDKLIFKDKKLGFEKFCEILQNNWENNELLRQYVLNKFEYYGNDNDEADFYTVRVLNDFASIVQETAKKECSVLFPAGISTFGRQIEWAKYRTAVPFGFKKGEILSQNASPTPNTDLKGVTAAISSYCKISLENQPCGAALDVKILPSVVAGENGLKALIGLINGFVKKNGFFMQIDVVEEKILLKAQKEPEKYKTLSVRVSGWNARFVTLDEEWQNMIIKNTAKGK